MTSLVLMASSGGGHAVQARLLQPAFADRQVAHIIAGGSGSGFRDCSLSTAWLIPICLWQAIWHVRRLRPELVISTGALPGLMAVIVGRLTGAHTIWVDSVANARKLSLSGKAARVVAHKTYTQWPEIAVREHVSYAGAIL